VTWLEREGCKDATGSGRDGGDGVDGTFWWCDKIRKLDLCKARIQDQAPTSVATSMNGGDFIVHIVCRHAGFIEAVCLGLCAARTCMQRVSSRMMVVMG
jgi:hypothetical protein